MRRIFRTRERDAFPRSSRDVDAQRGGLPGPHGRRSPSSCPGPAATSRQAPRSDAPLERRPPDAPERILDRPATRTAADRPRRMAARAPRIASRIVPMTGPLRSTRRASGRPRTSGPPAAAHARACSGPRPRPGRRSTSAARRGRPRPSVAGANVASPTAPGRPSSASETLAVEAAEPLDVHPRSPSGPSGAARRGCAAATHAAQAGRAEQGRDVEEPSRCRGVARTIPVRVAAHLPVEPPGSRAAGDACAPGRCPGGREVARGRSRHVRAGHRGAGQPLGRVAAAGREGREHARARARGCRRPLHGCCSAPKRSSPSLPRTVPPQVAAERAPGCPSKSLSAPTVMTWS